MFVLQNVPLLSNQDSKFVEQNAYIKNGHTRKVISFRQGIIASINNPNAIICDHRQDKHSSNRISFTINLTTGIGFWRCLDSECGLKAWGEKKYI